jgi:hypothetical protein
MIDSEPYQTALVHWPAQGRHILAQYDADSVVVYQAYRPSIGEYAIAHQRFGGADFSLSRMSWIKPNFLWMMYRSGWGTKEGQEVVLAVRLRRAAFDAILAAAVPSVFWPDLYDARASWQRDVASSEVRLQWDPDHAPTGDKVERRALQLGLRGEVLARFAIDDIMEIEDMRDFVATQRAHVRDRELLRVPRERVYPVADLSTRRRLRLDSA